MSSYPNQNRALRASPSPRGAGVTVLVAAMALNACRG